MKRKLAVEQEEERGEAPAESDDLREALREVLLDYAKEVAGAENRGEVIGLVESVDEYVDRAMEVA